MSNRTGLTLVEMLVVVAVTLVFMFALTQVFALLGDGITSGRALIELNAQKRAITLRLQSDLDNISVPAIPWATLQNGGGYLEIFEGPRTDKDTNNNGTADVNEPSFDTRYGDYDDVIMFTARSYDVPFVGRTQLATSPTVESNIAEIVWWTYLSEQDDLNDDGVLDPGETKTLYRRVLLVKPELANEMLSLSTVSRDEFFRNNDISARWENGTWVPNALADLTKRENRFSHNPTKFPHALYPSDPNDPNDLLKPFAPGSEREGDDVMLTRVLAFDVRVFDPLAPLDVDVGTQILSPSDPDWHPPSNPNDPIVPRGAYVDLHYAGNAPLSYSAFSGPPNAKSLLDTAPKGGTYCTWSFHYEHDGKPVGVPHDLGTNGFDDDGRNGVDDPGERETSPPYPVRLRGMQVRIRVYEPDSQTVRQSTVTTTFSQ